MLREITNKCYDCKKAFIRGANPECQEYVIDKDELGREVLHTVCLKCGRKRKAGDKA